MSRGGKRGMVENRGGKRGGGGIGNGGLFRPRDLAITNHSISIIIIITVRENLDSYDGRLWD